MSSQASVSTCLGIQHSRLTSYAKDKASRAYCQSKWSCIQNRWHSKQCIFIVDPAGNAKKRRCSKCSNAHSAIRPTRHPELYPEKATAQESKTVDLPAAVAAADPAESEPDQPALSARSLLFPDEASLIKLIEQQIGIVGDVKDLSIDAELALVAKALKLKGQLSVTIGNGKVYIVCNGNDCHSSFIKKNRANVQATCERCKHKKHDVKRIAARKEAHKENRVAANSSVPMSALDDNELAQRLANIKSSSSHKTRKRKSNSVQQQQQLVGPLPKSSKKQHTTAPSTKTTDDNNSNQKKAKSSSSPSTNIYII